MTLSPHLRKKKKKKKKGSKSKHLVVLTTITFHPLHWSKVVFHTHVLGTVQLHGMRDRHRNKIFVTG